MKEVSILDKKSPQIEAIVFDWAGTTVDYGCFAPLDVFKEVFKIRGIEVTDEETREPMGTLKWDHIQTMCNMDRIAQLWKEKYGRLPVKEDVDALYADYEPMLLARLPNYCTPVPGMIDLLGRLRSQGLKIGSTTGYTSKMMEIVAPGAKQQGYAPDSMVTPDDVPAGRPLPWMIYQNAMNLGVGNMKHIIKAGDTLSDVREGVNAGVWSVGILLGSSEMGLHEAEANAMDPDELADRMEAVAKKFKEAGAHYIINSVGDLDKLIPKINARLKNGD